MAEEEIKTPVAGTSASDTSAGPDTKPVAPAPNNGVSDAVELARKVGELTGKLGEAEQYKQKTEPVLELIFGDQELYQTVLKKYQDKVSGKDTSTADEANKGKDTKPDEPVVSKIEQDNRNTLIAQTVSGWEAKHGIDKLETEKKAEINNKVLGNLKEMLDPAGTGKEGAALLEGVSLQALPKLLDNAFFLATREEREENIKNQAVSDFAAGSTGIIGALPSSSVGSEEVTLSAKEREIARKQGVSEEQYLKNKIEIAKRDNSIY